jgi:hypothetical protein
MALIREKQREVKCPAGEDVHPVLSPNTMDVQCRIQGGLRPQTDPNGGPAVCCANYVDCSIWRTHKEIECAPSSKKQRDATRRPLHSHTLSRDARRDTLRV